MITGDFNALYILGKLQYASQARPDKSNMVLYSKNLISEKYELFRERSKDLIRIKNYLFNFNIIGINAPWGAGKTYLIQKLQNEIDTLESDIDSLQMQKQELVSFNRVAEVATSKGYTYQNDATASTTGAQQ